jgi:hypothetical protein
MALTPPPGGHREELILKLVVVPDANSEKQTHPMPIYRFKIKAQGVLSQKQEGTLLDC